MFVLLFVTTHLIPPITDKPGLIMVNVTKGIMVECDPAMKQFLLHLDEKFLLGSKFIIQDLDDSHLFISADVLDMLKSQIDDLMDKISVPIVEGKEGLKN